MWGHKWPTNLKPLPPITSAKAQILPNIYETLYWRKSAQEFGTEFVSSSHWCKETQQLTLRLKSRRFHSGREVTSEDVVYSLCQGFKHQFRQSNNCWNYSAIQMDTENFSIINPKTFIVRLKSISRRQFFTEISKLFFAIRPKDSDATSHIIGTGPYVVSSRISSAGVISLDRSPMVNIKGGAFDGLEFIEFEDQWQKEEAFREGQIHEFTHFGQARSLPADLIESAVANDFQYVSLLQLNGRSELFSNSNRRYEFSKVAALCVQSMDPTFRFLPSTGIIPQGYLGHRQKPLLQPVSGPKESIVELTSIKVGITNLRQKSEMQTVFKEDLLSYFGMKLEYVLIESCDQRAEYARDLKVDAILVNLKVKNDNCKELISIFASDHPKNYMGIKNDEVDRWIQSLPKSKSKQVELEKFKKIEELVMQSCYCLPLGYIPTFQVRQSQWMMDSDLWFERGAFVPVTSEKVANQLQSRRIRFEALQNQVTELMEYKQAYAAIEQIDHDLRTPITALNLLKDGDPLDHRSQRLLVDSVERINGLVSELHSEVKRIHLLKDFTSFVENKKGFQRARDEHPQVVSLLDTVITVVGEVQVARPDHQSLKVHPSQSLDSLVCLDPHQLKRALSNVINNSLETTKGAKASVNIELYNEGPNKVVLEVIDDGPGMTPQQLEKIFEHGFSGANKGSSGLGLTIAKSIIEAQEGEIEVHSFPGYGTTVRMKWPKTQVTTTPSKPMLS